MTTHRGPFNERHVDLNDPIKITFRTDLKIMSSLWAFPRRTVFNWGSSFDIPQAHGGILSSILKFLIASLFWIMRTWNKLFLMWCTSKNKTEQSNSVLYFWIKEQFTILTVNVFLLVVTVSKYFQIYLQPFINQIKQVSLALQSSLSWTVWAVYWTAPIVVSMLTVSSRARKGVLHAQLIYAQKTTCKDCHLKPQILPLQSPHRSALHAIG